MATGRCTIGHSAIAVSCVRTVLVLTSRVVPCFLPFESVLAASAIFSQGVARFGPPRYTYRKSVFFALDTTGTSPGVASNPGLSFCADEAGLPRAWPLGYTPGVKAFPGSSGALTFLVKQTYEMRAVPTAGVR